MMTTYPYLRTEVVNGTTFVVGRSEGGNGPPQVVRIALPADSSRGFIKAQHVVRIGGE